MTMLFRAVVAQEGVIHEYTDGDVNRLLFCILSMHPGLLLKPVQNIFTVSKPTFKKYISSKSLTYSISMFFDGKPMPLDMMWEARKTYIQKRIAMKVEKSSEHEAKRALMKPKEYEYIKREPSDYNRAKKNKGAPSEHARV